jgi:hypothetical protein
VRLSGLKAESILVPWVVPDPGGGALVPRG